MTAPPLAQYPKWRDDLILALRVKNVPGDQIGDILLEVESHVTETGESPEEAFGKAKDYAASRVVVKPDPPEEDMDLVAQILIPGIGGFLLATGAFDLGAGQDSWAGWRPWLMLIAGFAIMVVTFLRLPVDDVRDPRSNSPILGSQRQFILIILGSFVIAAVLMFWLGWLIAP